MASSTASCIFPKLCDNSSFSNWKFRVKILLEERGLINALTGTDLKDRESLQNDAKARSVIVQCISDQHLEIIKKCSTAFEMITKLEQVFERKSVFNKLYLRKKLLSLRCEATDKLQNHFMQFDNIIAELEATGTNIDMSDKVCHLLLTMPNVYDNVITSLETMSENKELTIEFVKSRLLDAELKIKNNNESKEIGADCFLTCYKCGIKGHMAYQCKKLNVNHARGKSRGRGTPKSRSRGKYMANMISSSDYVKQETSQNFIALSTEYKVESNDKEILFVVDSGATHHFIQDKYIEYMTDIKNLEKPIKIKIANGETILAQKSGTLQLYYNRTKITLEGLIVPSIEHNLLSVNTLMSKGKVVVFKEGQLKIHAYNETFYGEMQGKLHILRLKLPGKQEHCKYIQGNNKCKDLWHIRLGHLNRKGLKIMNLPYTTDICNICMRNKSTRLPFLSINKAQSKSIGELIHSDVSGPMRTVTNEGYRYFQTIIDDFSHFTQTYLLRQKSEASENIMNYINEIEREKNIKIKRIRCDNGGEYTGNMFKKFCHDKGIRLEYTLPYSPQMNGKSERMNRTIYDKARTILDSSNLPRYLWGHAILTATYLVNRCPSRSINNNIPAKKFGRDMELQRLRPFGCKGWMVILPKGDKLDARAKEVRMIGYARNGYKVWDPNSDEVIVTRDVRFDELNLRYENKEEIKEQEVIIEESKNYEYDKEEKNYIEDAPTPTTSTESYEEQDVPKITRAGRIVKNPTYLSEYELHEAYCLINFENEPQSFEEATSSGWTEAINNELNALSKMKTWEETKLPEKKQAIDTKWIFKVKENGQKKARLVARGFQIKENEEFGKNYAPVARTSTVRTIFSHAVHNNFQIRQLDVPTAFLNGLLESEVYIKPPQGVKMKNSNNVLKLNRGLYGLRESPKCWNQRFNDYVEKKGFKRSQHDFCLYIEEQKKIWMVIYVDDIILTGMQENLEEIIQDLVKEFQVKDFGFPKLFLGMEITRKENSLKITQKRQIQKMLEKFKMTDCNSVNTPLCKGYQYDEKEEVLLDIPYRQLIGSIMFVATVSRPDITFAVSYLSQYLDKPTKSLWTQAKRILRYLKGSQEIGLLYEKKDIQSLETYSDADWAGNQTDRKSVSGSITKYCGNVVAWFSRKQTCVALSTVEAEYIAAATSACDLLYVKGLYSDLNGLNSEVKCILYMDNRGAIHLSKSFENSKRAKHIEIKNHFLKDLTIKIVICVQYIPTDNNVADLLTKALSNEKLTYMRTKLNIE